LLHDFDKMLAAGELHRITFTWQEVEELSVWGRGDQFVQYPFIHRFSYCADEQRPVRQSSRAGDVFRSGGDGPAKAAGHHSVNRECFAGITRVIQLQA
jgi:hypothetical protein